MELQLPVAGRSVRLGAFYDHEAADVIASGFEEQIGDGLKWNQQAKDGSLGKRISFLVRQSEEYKSHFFDSKQSNCENWQQKLTQLECPPDAVQVIVRLVLLKRTESVQEKFIASKMCELSRQLTNRSLVKGIVYGSESVLILQRTLEDEGDRQHVQDELFLAAKSFLTRILYYDGPLDQYSSVLDQANCFYCSDCDHSGEALQFRQYLDILLPQLNDQIEWKALNMILEATSDLIQKQLQDKSDRHRLLLKYIDDVDEQVSKLNNPFLDKILYAKEHIQVFQNALSKLRSTLGDPAADVAGHSSHFIDEVYRHCFQSALLDEWLSRKRMEINRLRQLLDGTHLKIESVEQLVQKPSSVKVYQLKASWVPDELIGRICQFTGQRENHFRFVFDIVHSSSEQFESVLRSFRFFASQAKHKRYVYFGVCPSHQWPDGSIVTWHSSATNSRSEQLPRTTTPRNVPTEPNSCKTNDCHSSASARQTRPEHNLSRGRGSRRPNFAIPYQAGRGRGRSVFMPTDGLMSVTINTEVGENAAGELQDNQLKDEWPASRNEASAPLTERRTGSQSEFDETDRAVGWKRGGSQTRAYSQNRRPRISKAFLERAQKYKDGNPAIYFLPANEKASQTLPLRWFDIGKPNPSVSHKTILLMGATGSGKSTLVDAMVNYVLDVQWKDNFRFKVVPKEGDASQASSQTRSITAYTIHHAAGMRIPHSLTIIDTPGYGDTEGLATDEQISDSLCKFFIDSETNVHQVDAVCFVASSADARLTPTQEYVISSVLSIFGKDMSDNIRLLATFCDGAVPPVVEACRQARFPLATNCDADSYAKFNNSCIFAANGAGEGFIGQMYWDMASTNFGKFFDMIAGMQPKSLEQTRQVIRKRLALNDKLEEVQHKLEQSLDEVYELHIARNSAIQANKEAHNMKKPELIKVRKPCGDGFTVYNCNKCQKTCSGPQRKLTKSEKKSFSEKKCPCRCASSEHEFHSSMWAEQKIEVDQQADEGTAVAELEKQLNTLKTSMVDLLKEMSQLNDELEEIALRYGAPTTDDSVKMLQNRLRNDMPQGFETKCDILDELLHRWRSQSN